MKTGGYEHEKTTVADMPTSTVYKSIAWGVACRVLGTTEWSLDTRIALSRDEARGNAREYRYRTGSIWETRVVRLTVHYRVGKQ